jgi:serine/threonine-protein kinase
VAGDNQTKEMRKGGPPPQSDAPASSSPGAASTSATLALDAADALAATQAAEAIANGTTSLVGATIANRYKVLKRLGEGGMGTVYEALHTVLEKHVALKVLHPELARKAQLVERFLQEAKAASRIRHENVIDISDFGSADGHVYFAMELLKGHDLHEEITRARGEGKLLPWARTKNIFLQVCSALAVAHERGIVHRDLKPENVYLIEFRGDPDFVKLLDFGIAKMTDVSTNEEGRKLTKTGMLFGTPEYMAPEQARGERADHRVDIYAMGCLLFLLVTNRLPFQAENFMGVLSQHLTDEPPEIAPETFDQIGAPRELAEVIDRALEKDRELRWQTIDEFAAAICEVCGDPLPKERSRPNKAPSVAAPGETTRIRTPTDQVTTRSRTPSGPQRLKSPTGPQRPRTATGERSKPPTKPPPSRPSIAHDEQWTGSIEEPPALHVALGPVPEHNPKGTIFAIVSGVFVLGTIAIAAFALGWFDGSPKKSDPAAAGSAAGSAASQPPEPGVPGAPVDPRQPLPETADLVIDSSPQGASIFAQPSNTVIGKTPFTVTVIGSATARHYKLSLAGYEDMTVDVVPNKARVEVKPQLVRTSAAGGVKATPRDTATTTTTTTTTHTAGDSSTAVTKPDLSTAVTKPDMTPVTTPEKAPEQKPDPTPTPTPDDDKEPAEPDPAPESGGNAP